MVLIIFIFLLLAVLFAWKGHRRNALIFYGITLGLSVLWFIYVMDVHTLIQL